MLNVKQWDSSMLILKKAEVDVLYENIQQPGNNNLISTLPNCNNSFMQNPPNQSDQNQTERECCICFVKHHKLISCDDCPCMFHSECLGYTSHLPRGKWKCYFCKVIRHGIPNKVARLAPN